MGYELWVSPLTGKRRHGTDFKSLKKIFMDSVTTKNICEPLLSCEMDMVATDIRDMLSQRDFDFAGVIDENKKVVGYVSTQDLGDGVISDYRKNIERDTVISDSTPIPLLISELSIKECLYVNFGRDILFIVTKADLNKPPVRMFVFGVISLFEMHLNYWVSSFYKNDDDIKAVIGEERFTNAFNLYQAAKENNENEGVNLVGYLQLGDKKKLLCCLDEFCRVFMFSKKKIKKFIEIVQKLRDNIAHSQSSIFTEVDLKGVSAVLTDIEIFIESSEHIIINNR
ncbi:TPA: hypothetical protein ACKP0Y_004314 [Serratia marcescens]